MFISLPAKWHEKIGLATASEFFINVLMKSGRPKAAPTDRFVSFFFAGFYRCELHTSPAAIQKYGDEVTELMLKNACIR